MMISARMALRHSRSHLNKRLFCESAKRCTKIHVVDHDSALGTVKKRPTVLQHVGRATVTGTYFLAVSAGILLLGVVVYALGSNLVYETRYFGEAVELIRNNAEVKSLLGDNIKAFGQRNEHRGRRGAGVQSQRSSNGKIFMLFNVEGSKGLQGICRLEVVEQDHGHEIKQLYVDIDQSRIWLKQETLPKKTKRLFSR